MTLVGRGLPQSQEQRWLPVSPKGSIVVAIVWVNLAKACDGQINA